MIIRYFLNVSGTHPPELPGACLIPGGGGTSYNGPYREVPPERGTFYRLEVHKRVGISRAKV